MQNPLKVPRIIGTFPTQSQEDKEENLKKKIIEEKLYKDPSRCFPKMCVCVFEENLEKKIIEKKFYKDPSRCFYNSVCVGVSNRIDKVLTHLEKK